MSIGRFVKDFPVRKLFEKRTHSFVCVLSKVYRSIFTCVSEAAPGGVRFM